MNFFLHHSDSPKRASRLPLEPHPDPRQIVVARIGEPFTRTMARASLLEARRRTPWAPLVLQLARSNGPVPPEVAAEIGALARDIGCRFIDWQMQLADTSDSGGLWSLNNLPRQIRVWLQVALERPMPIRCRGAVDVLLQRTRPLVQLPRVDELLREHGFEPRSVNRALHSAGINGAGRVRQCGRVIRAAGFLKRAEPPTTIERAAWEVGYSQAPSLARSMKSVADLTPQQALLLPGWEWIAWKGLIRR